MKDSEEIRRIAAIIRDTLGSKSWRYEIACLERVADELEREEQVWHIEVRASGQVVACMAIEAAQLTAISQGQNGDDFELLIETGLARFEPKGPVAVRLFRAPRPQFDNDE